MWKIKWKAQEHAVPIPFIYDTFTYMNGCFFMVNVRKYTIVPRMVRYGFEYDTPPGTNIYPENRPEIPIGNHHFQGLC